MFSYYGSKSKIAGLYPPPKHGKIIEPFAGSARYSLLHFENDVWLYDVSEFVIAVWEYLIQASERDVLSLPEPPSKVSIDTIRGLSPAERYLIGFHLCRGKAKPRKVGHGQNGWPRDKKRIASSLYKIRHWKIRRGSFESIRDRRATWFIDPPYKTTQERDGNSDRYEHWKIDHKKLAKFARSRTGSVIVCEGDGADWLPFRHLATTHANTNAASVKTNNEFIWTKRI